MTTLKASKKMMLTLISCEELSCIVDLQIVGTITPLFKLNKVNGSSLMMKKSCPLILSVYLKNHLEADKVMMNVESEMHIC